MTGKQIAENLRANRHRWTRHKYYRAIGDGQYCVIGLKLMEQGVAVEKWDDDQQGEMINFMLDIRLNVGVGPFTTDGYLALSELQVANDEAKTADEIINWCEKNAEKDFPIEKLAELLKRWEKEGPRCSK